MPCVLLPRLINNNEDAISEITLPRTKTMWSELNKCFNVVGFTEMETQSLFHVLAGVLHLGDVEIGGEGENAYLVSADEILRKVSEQFQINMAPFQEALVVQTITTRGESVARHYKQVCPLQSQRTSPAMVHGCHFLS
jgi:myosin heavy subunit